MIIQPDFLTHWKTKALIDELGPEAPLYLIRLWAYCQQRKAQTVFEDLPTRAIKAICEYSGDAEELNQSLIDNRWIKRDGERVEILNWQEYNQKLIAARQNGKKGGRPPKDLEKPPEKKPPKKKEWQPDERQQRINSWYRRKDSTRWSDKEIAAYRKIPPDPEEFETMEFYYTAEIKNKNEDIRRRDIGTLLNNWTGEADRARAYFEKHRRAGEGNW
jgi:hypothetical protein